MSAFAGLRIPYSRPYRTSHSESPVGPPHYPGDYAVEASGREFEYPWGRKEPNPVFIGPVRPEWWLTMTDKLRAAAQAALDAIEELEYRSEDPTANARVKAENAKRKLRAALAEPEVEQEPVAWRDAEPVAWADEIIEAVQAMYDTEGIREDGSGDALIRLSDAIGAVEDAEKRHPQRREWVGLTDEEIAEIHRTCKPAARPWPLSRAIEAALKEKNA